MLNFTASIVIYTFAIFGAIAFFTEIINSFKYYKNNNKIILVVKENQENVEMVLREIINIIKRNAIANKVYIYLDDENDINVKIVEKLAKKNNIILVTKDTEQLINIVEGKM